MPSRRVDTARARDARRVMDCLRRIVRELQTASRSRSSKVRLSGAQLWVLQQIGKTPGITLTQLAAQTLTNTSTVSELTSRMVKAGYVKRGSHRADGRRITLSLTGRGMLAVRGSQRAFQDRLTGALLGLPQSQVARLADAFAAWVGAAKLKRTPAKLLNSHASPIDE